MEEKDILNNYIQLYLTQARIKSKVRIDQIIKKLETEDEKNYISQVCLKFPKTSSYLLFLYCQHLLQHSKKPACFTCGKEILQMGNGLKKLAVFCSYSCINTQKMGSLVREALVQKHGVTNSMMIPGAKEKVKQTSFTKYGVTHHNKLNTQIEKRRDNNLKKYGVTSTNKLATVKEKQKVAMIEKYGKGSFGGKLLYNRIFNKLQAKGFTLQVSEEDYKGVQNTYPILCKECNSVFLNSLNNGMIPYCTTCNPKSRLELKVRNLIDKTETLITNKRNTLGGLELDIYIPEKNLAIECHGLRWHSFYKDSYTKDLRNKHYEKYYLCKQKGIHLLQFFEDEINLKTDLVNSIISINLSKIKRKIYARNCLIKEISSKQELRSFLNINHIQGYTPSKINLGLYYGEELVQLMTFSVPRFNKKYDYELIRLCTTMDTIVLGGAAKLFKFFTTNYLGGNEKVISYCDLRLFKGTIYSSLGFLHIHNTKPNYYYIDKYSTKRFSRLTFQKHKLSKLLPIFDIGKTEIENMLINDYRIVFDCGNSVWEYTKPAVDL